MLDCLDEVVDESLCAQVFDDEARRFLRDLTPNGMQQVRLPEANPAVDEQGVIGVAWLVSYSEGSCVCKLIRRAHNEIFEGESKVCIEHRKIFSRTMCNQAG